MKLKSIFTCLFFISMTTNLFGSYFTETHWPKVVHESLFEFSVLMEKELGHISNEKYMIALGEYYEVKPVVMDKGDQNPSSGIWIQKFKLKRGNEERLFSAAFIAVKDNVPTAMPLVAGNTNTWIRLQLDVYDQVITTAYDQLGVTTDESPLIVDAKVVKQPFDYTEENHVYKGVWEEEWIVRVKGKTTPVRILFIPDETGTTFLIVSRK